MEPHDEQQPHGPSPSLWPVGFAVGIAVLLAGIVVGWLVAAIGAALLLIFGFLWIRDVAAGSHTGLPDRADDTAETGAGAAPVVAGRGEAALPVADDEEVERFPRSRFLEASTLGLGAAIGGLVTAPVLGFAVAPAFRTRREDDIDIGALADFPEGEWIIATFLLDPAQGEVSRRTAFVRYNGQREGQPSFTVVSNRCVHLGCPVQPNGPINEDAATREETENTVVTRIPTSPAGFGCPCHGGQYDNEGNRTAGPPVRALDRYRFSISNGRLLLGEAYSVGEVEGEGAQARIERYGRAFPGVHVDGLERWLYPVEPPK